MHLRLYRTFGLIVAVMLSLYVSVLANDDPIAGTVLDADDRPVTNVAVILCDQASGIPIAGKSGQPFTKDGNFQDIAFALTDAQGRFAFGDVKPGTYRLLAQSWEDAELEIKEILAVNGRTVHLRGIVSKLTVPSPAARSIVIRPAGSATLHITTDPQAPNDETLLVLSSAALATDPVLAFAAWTGPFIPNMLAGNRMPHGKTTVLGLPEGTLHLGAFAADNNPGFGGTQCKLQKHTTSTIKIPLIASWSDGHKEPPTELKKLVQRFTGPEAKSLMDVLRKSDPDTAKAFGEARAESRQLGANLGPLLERSIPLSANEQVLLKDLLAADAYARLLQYDQQRKARAQLPPEKKIEVAPTITYAEALQDLHARLGRDYPCFELKQIDWQAVGKALLPQAETVSSDEEFGLLCLQMVAALKDSHAQLLPAKAKIPTVPFPSWDAGFACLVDDRGEPVVYYIAPDSSAAESGLQIGSTIKSINKTDAKVAIKQTMDRLSKYVGYSSDRYLRYHAFRFFARQMERNAPVELAVSTPDGTEKTFSLQTMQGAGYLPRLPVPNKGIADSGSVSWKMLKGDVGYIYVRRIREDLITSLDRAVKDLREAKGLVIDVRGNSGGGFDASRSFRNFDLEDGAEPNRPRFTKQIAVLIDARCISAGEGWTSWFVARQRAKLFGETTAGASARKTTYLLRNGLYSVRYPVKAYRGSLDRVIERRGLEPDVPIMPQANDIAEGRDTVLEAARERLAKGD